MNSPKYYPWGKKCSRCNRYVYKMTMYDPLKAHSDMRQNIKCENCNYNWIVLQDEASRYYNELLNYINDKK